MQANVVLKPSEQYLIQQVQTNFYMLAGDSPQQSGPVVLPNRALIAGLLPLHGLCC